MYKQTYIKYMLSPLHSEAFVLGPTSWLSLPPTDMLRYYMLRFLYKGTTRPCVTEEYPLTNSPIRDTVTRDIYNVCDVSAKGLTIINERTKTKVALSTRDHSMLDSFSVIIADGMPRRFVYIHSDHTHVYKDDGTSILALAHRDLPELRCFGEDMVLTVGRDTRTIYTIDDDYVVTKICETTLGSLQHWYRRAEDVFVIFTNEDDISCCTLDDMKHVTTITLMPYIVLYAYRDLFVVYATADHIDNVTWRITYLRDASTMIIHSYTHDYDDVEPGGCYIDVDGLIHMQCGETEVEWNGMYYLK